MPFLDIQNVTIAQSYLETIDMIESALPTESEDVIQPIKLLNEKMKQFLNEWIAIKLDLQRNQFGFNTLMVIEFKLF